MRHAGPDFRSLEPVEGFALSHAFWLARAAELVYESPDLIETELREGWGVDQFEFLDVNDTQCMLAANERFVVVGFRGTEPNSLQDWVTDARTELVPGPLDGKVHAGFYDSLANVWQLLDRTVRKWQEQKPRALLVGGHSLGAALATLAVARWLGAGREVHSLYTFGQPRTGDSTFARHFNFEFKHSTFRFVNNNDLVTRIPPRAFGYSHLGTFKYFTEAGELAGNIGWWNRFLDGWRGRIEDILYSGDDGIKDHSMSEYRRRLISVLSALQSPDPLFDLRDGVNRFLTPFLCDEQRASSGYRAAA